MEDPRRLPNSLALCVLDSIWSIGVNYDRHVRPVLARYREIATDAGRDGDAGTPDDLVTTVERCGGPAAFAEVVRSRHRTSSKNRILKAQAVLEAGQLLPANNVATARDLTTRQAEVKPGWYRIRGQRSGVSWKYFLMLAGIDGIKPDRMIHGFITEALGVTVTNDEAVALLTRVQRGWSEPRPTLLGLDHAIWRHQSVRPVISADPTSNPLNGRWGREAMQNTLPSEARGELRGSASTTHAPDAPIWGLPRHSGGRRSVLSNLYRHVADIRLVRRLEGMASGLVPAEPSRS